MVRRAGSRRSNPRFVEPLAELGTQASYPALPLQQNEHKFYLLTIPVHDIFPFCYVARRGEDPVQGFQRTLNEDRAKDISSYLDNSKGSIPTNIVLSAQSDADLTYVSRTKLLKYKRQQSAFLVLDGQHRLFGYGMTRKEHRVPVAIYEGLSRQDEAALFIDINTNQRGVPASLLLDIKQIAARENEAEAQLRTMFDRLGMDPESPMNGLLTPHQSAAGKISRVAFNRSVKPILASALMDQLSEEKRYELLRNYLRGFSDNLRDDRLLRKAAYFEGFCSVFEDVVKASIAEEGNAKQDSLNAILAPLENLDLTHLSTGGGTRLNKEDIASALRSFLAHRVDIDDDLI